jgi:hypothetical protein
MDLPLTAQKHYDKIQLVTGIGFLSIIRQRLVQPHSYTATSLYHETQLSVTRSSARGTGCLL